MPKEQTEIKGINLIFPNQLFKENPLLHTRLPIYLVEEFLYFKQYAFHKQKIAFHRATMKFYADYLKAGNHHVTYIDAQSEISDIRKLIPFLKQQGIAHIHYLHPADNWLQRRLTKGCQAYDIETTILPTPMFLNSPEQLNDFFKPEKKKYHQTSFYIEQRKKRNLLMDTDGKPAGGKWTFDTENRKKYPAKKTPPPIQYPNDDAYDIEAREYVAQHFSTNYGELTAQPLYPNSFAKTQEWLRHFLDYRFTDFGIYEDAIVAENSILNHSVLTPMLNVGLITPNEIVAQSLSFAAENDIPINSTEGFIRQIIGWREFIHGVYEVRGSYERTKHFWKFSRKIPKSFYDGTTGILPLDQTIKKVLKTGYCHHIERLMVLGNFMVLCEFDPDEVHQWFMELFIDAYDWVMVPNVYGMSQFADGGLMSTKPYISGSNYLMKMSDYKKGGWEDTWDGLFWRFMHTHRSFFLSNPRLGMLVNLFDKMPNAKKQHLLNLGNTFLTSLN
ncbi:MAG: cryptochrome/photolyase family protein [Flavobacteriaceae bacterium]